MRDWRCQLRLHAFALQKSPDGRESYLECRRCGRYKELSGTTYEMLWDQGPPASG
jgi:hypothetical protein